LAIFGEGGDQLIDEETPPSGCGPAQMVQVCLAWETAFTSATAAVDRTVLLRLGIALGGSGDPVTERLTWLVRRGLGGKAGSGKQWVSWVALEDLLKVMLRAIDDENMTGLCHVTSPHPITNADMMATYRELLGRRFGLPAPAPVTFLGAILLGSDSALALTGRRCVPARLLGEGFEFSVPTFREAVAKALTSTY
jgi:NAD dependent epimerase/dehydratase family enzyme